MTATAEFSGASDEVEAQPDEQSSLREVLSDLITVTHRLTRLAAQATGNQESPAIWRTMSVLATMGPMRLGELAAQSRVSQPTMTKIVKNLAETEWIKRIADKSDARAWQIAAAPKGLTALAEWRVQLGEALTPVFADLSASERDVLERAVHLLQDRIAVEQPGR